MRLRLSECRCYLFIAVKLECRNLDVFVTILQKSIVSCAKLKKSASKEFKVPNKTRLIFRFSSKAD